MAVTIETLKSLGGKSYFIPRNAGSDHHIVIVEGIHDEISVWYNQSIILSEEAQRRHAERGLTPPDDVYGGERYDFYPEFQRVLMTESFGYREQVDEALKQHWELRAKQAREARELAGPEVESEISIWSNQGYRDALVLARRGDLALVAYVMPAGRVSLVEMARRYVPVEDIQCKEFRQWIVKRSISRKALSQAWIKAIREGMKLNPEAVLDEVYAGHWFA